MAENATTASWGYDQPAALIVATPDRMAAHARAVEASGARLVGQVDHAAAAGRIRDQITLDLVLFDAQGAAPALAEDTADLLARSSIAHGYRVVALCDRDGIDTVASPLLEAGATLLCEASPAEQATALLHALPHPARLNDVSREREAERLRMLNEEVARLAEVLTQLAAERADTGVRAAATAFRSEPVAEPDADPRTVRATIRGRRLRDQYFTGELFADPAWDMLLDLYAARLEGRRVSVSSLCIAAAVPPTTALRWIGTMHDAQLFGREADPTDKRRAHITLTERAAGGMRGYFAAAVRQGVVAI